jgi:hypothetical protein
MYLKSFEYFRAVAISFIVIGHCYGVSGWKIQCFGERVLANILSGGTTLFVFISGFLFHHIFYPRFQSGKYYGKFLKNKFYNVYMPYLILSIYPVCMALYRKSPYTLFYFGPENTIYDQIIRPALMYYWYGGVMVYWYIPFIMTIFIISPVFIWFIEQSTKKQIYIVIFSSIVAMLVHRPVHNWFAVQSVVYFSPIYMFGILCSIQKEWIYKKFQGKDLYLFTGVLFFAVLQAIFYKYSGNPQKWPLEFKGIDISFMQKNILAVFFMVFLHRFEDKDIPILNQLAVSSFSIYFLHYWFIDFIGAMKRYWISKELIAPFQGLLFLPVFTALVIWLSYLVASKIKKTFPKKSRMIVGW